jgi:hypothetical protein
MIRAYRREAASPLRIYGAMPGIETVPVSGTPDDVVRGLREVVDAGGGSGCTADGTCGNGGPLGGGGCTAEGVCGHGGPWGGGGCVPGVGCFNWGQ